MGIDGSSIADDNASISGTVQAPANSAVSVNGQAAALAPNGHFFIGDIELRPGTNVLTVTVNTLEGAPIVRTINVASTGIAPFKVSLDKQEGFSPLTVNLTITNRGNVPFQRIEIDWNGDGTTDATLMSLVDNERRIAVTYNNAGTYQIRVAVYDASNTVVYSATRTVRVYSKAELGLKLVGAYVGMVDRLGANDATGALRYFTADAQTRYRVVFDALAGMLPSVAAQLRTIIDGAITEDTAELTILENTTSGQEDFMIYLIRGGDGIWRIENM
jgi:PKD repeat protein